MGLSEVIESGSQCHHECAHSGFFFFFYWKCPIVSLSYFLTDGLIWYSNLKGSLAKKIFNRNIISPAYLERVKCSQIIVANWRCIYKLNWIQFNLRCIKAKTKENPLEPEILPDGGDGKPTQNQPVLSPMGHCKIVHLEGKDCQTPHFRPNLSQCFDNDYWTQTTALISTEELNKISRTKANWKESSFKLLCFSA